MDLVHAQAKAMLQAAIAWQQQQRLGVSCRWAAAMMALVSASRCGQPSAGLHNEYSCTSLRGQSSMLLNEHFSARPS